MQSEPQFGKMEGFWRWNAVMFAQQYERAKPQRDTLQKG